MGVPRIVYVDRLAKDGYSSHIFKAPRSGWANTTLLKYHLGTYVTSTCLKSLASSYLEFSWHI